jgi:hypothetical protein
MPVCGQNPKNGIHQNSSNNVTSVPVCAHHPWAGATVQAFVELAHSLKNKTNIFSSSQEVDISEHCGICTNLVKVTPSSPTILLSNQFSKGRNSLEFF